MGDWLAEQRGLPPQVASDQGREDTAQVVSRFEAERQARAP